MAEKMSEEMSFEWQVTFPDGKLENYNCCGLTITQSGVAVFTDDIHGMQVPYLTLAPGSWVKILRVDGSDLTEGINGERSIS